MLITRTFGTLVILLSWIFIVQCQPLSTDSRLYELAADVSADRIYDDIQSLVNFGTRHTLSDTLSESRGIGAARRWIKSTFERISDDCGSCLEVRYHRGMVRAGESRRIPEDTWVVNVLAIKRGTQYPNRYVIMAGDIDSRISDPLNAKDDSPGANDNASGMAGVMEAARVLSRFDFPVSIIFAGLSGEEQGLFGGKFLAKTALEEEWDILGVLNNDMISNIQGIDGVIDNRSFRIFSEPHSSTVDEQKQIWTRFYGGEVDGPSRQLARYIHKLCVNYMPELNPVLIYRLDRFGRGGHHRPFNDAGFPGVRIMEMHEDYNRQHQDIRVEDGIEYGDVIQGVNKEYARDLTAVNVISLASLAWAPPPPQNVMIGGAVKPSTTLRWDVVDDKEVIGYKVYWRDTTSPQWQHSKYVGKVSEAVLSNVIIDNYLFGVVSVNKEGNESIVQYPKTLIPRR